jgi:hypothetical protein
MERKVNPKNWRFKKRQLLSLKEHIKKSTKEERQATLSKWFPIVISIVSLLVSSTTLWLTKLSSVKLNFLHTGRVSITSNPIRADKQLALDLQLLFYNDGAQQGYVRDVALVFRKTELPSKQIILRSVYEIVDDSLNLGKELPPPKMMPFNSFPVKGGETIVKQFVFVPDDSETELKYAIENIKPLCTQ